MDFNPVLLIREPPLTSVELNVERNGEPGGIKLNCNNTSPNITYKHVKSGYNTQGLVAFYQTLFDGVDNPYHYNPNECQNTKRKSIDSRPSSIIALTRFEKRSVTNIYDIAPGGV